MKLRKKYTKQRIIKRKIWKGYKKIKGETKIIVNLKKW